MGMLDDLLAQAGGNIDIAGLAGNTGLDAGALGALLPQLLQAVQGAGGAGGALEQVMAGLGGSQSGGAGSGMLGQVAGMLDRDGDGNPINDIMGMFGKK